jgi:hypothetical protein
MPRDWNGRAGCNRAVRAEPGTCAPARLTRREADHGGRRGALLAWQRCAVARLKAGTRYPCPRPCVVCVIVNFLFRKCPYLRYLTRLIFIFISLASIFLLAHSK